MRHATDSHPEPQRSKRARTIRWAAAAAALFATVALALAACGGEQEALDGAAGPVGPFPTATPSGPFPTPSGIAAARSYLAERAGRTAFAVIDSDGRLAGLNTREHFETASIVKVMFLTAYLQMLAARDRPLTAADRELLYPMIHESNNDDASAVLNIVGAEAVARVAREAGMRDYAPGIGWWAYTQTSAADQVRFAAKLDTLIPARFGVYARYLMSTIEPEQSWGFPPVARPYWHVYFKTGALPSRGLFTEVALLERGPVRFTAAVLTDGQPSQAYGEETIAGVAARLLGDAPEARGADRGPRRIAGSASIAFPPLSGAAVRRPSRERIRIARDRAGLTQQQLAERSGRPRETIVRWESGRQLPSLDAVSARVDQCELDLVLRLAKRDSTLHDRVDEQLALSPARRLKRLLSSKDTNDAKRALRWLASTRIPAVVVGQVGAALCGAPQHPEGPQVEFVAADTVAMERALLDAKLVPIEIEDRWRDTDARDPWTLPAGGMLAMARNVPGTDDYRDLRRSASTIAVDAKTSVMVAHARDLLRIADASPRASEAARVPGLQALLEATYS